MMKTINYGKNEPWNTYIRQIYKKHTLSNRALLHPFLKLGKFVWRDFLHSMIQQITVAIVMSCHVMSRHVIPVCGKSLTIRAFVYTVPECDGQTDGFPVTTSRYACSSMLTRDEKVLIFLLLLLLLLLRPMSHDPRRYTLSVCSSISAYATTTNPAIFSQRVCSTICAQYAGPDILKLYTYLKPRLYLSCREVQWDPFFYRTFPRRRERERERVEQEHNTEMRLGQVSGYRTWLDAQRRRHRNGGLEGDIVNAEPPTTAALRAGLISARQRS